MRVNRRQTSSTVGSATAASWRSRPNAASGSRCSIGWPRNSIRAKYYEERDVNDILREFHPDVAALRRYLVEEGFLDRTDGGYSYWRVGGSYDPS